MTCIISAIQLSHTIFSKPFHGKLALPLSCVPVIATYVRICAIDVIRYNQKIRIRIIRMHVYGCTE